MTLRPHKNTGELTHDLLHYLQGHFQAIPEDYQEFLRAKNGGTPTPELIFKFSSADDDGWIISNFTSIKCQKGQLSIDLQVEAWGLDYGPSFIPIADDEMGNYFLLSVAPESFGLIYYRDHELTDEDNPMLGLTFLAQTFTDFIQRLHDTDYTAPDWEAEHDAALRNILKHPK